MAPILYHTAASPPSRGALLTARAIGLDVEVKLLNILAGDHTNPEFLKLNPQHTVPTLVDGDFVLWESRAIAGYLVHKYGKDDSLYPRDPEKKAIVDQRLYFDAGHMFPHIRAICFPIIFEGSKKINEDSIPKVHQALEYLEKYLEGNTWVTGDKMTIADFALVASVSSIVGIGFDLSKYPGVRTWLVRCETDMPGYMEINQVGADDLQQLVRSRMTPPSQL